MPETHITIKRHIGVLETFERQYAEYLHAKRQAEAEGRANWSKRQLEAREEELKRLAPQADVAIDTSGVGRVEVHKTWPNGHQTLVADELAKLILGDGRIRFEKSPFTDDVRQEVLEALPGQIAGLKAQLESGRSARKRLEELGQRFRETFAWMKTRSGWRENVWIVTIGGTVIGGLILAAILAVISA